MHIKFPSFELNAFAFDETDQHQQNHGTDERANERADQIRRGDAEQPENKSAQHRADDTDDQISDKAEAVTFDHRARQKSGEESDKDKPKPVHNFILVGCLILTEQNEPNHIILQSAMGGKPRHCIIFNGSNAAWRRLVSYEMLKCCPNRRDAKVKRFEMGRGGTRPYQKN
jgi:hypothetical protein